MDSIFKWAEKYFGMTAAINNLEKRIDRIVDRIEDHEKRIIRLEIREELLQEKMANTAIKAVNEMNYKIFERLSAVENTVKSLPQSPSSDS